MSDIDELKALAAEFAAAGDTDRELEVYELLEKAQAAQAEPQGFLGATGETLGAIASGAATDVASGLAGIPVQAAESLSQAVGSDAVPLGTAADTVESVQGLAYQPTGERSIAQLQQIGSWFDSAMQSINPAIAKIGAMGKMLLTNDPVKAVEFYKDVSEKGISATLGDDTLEATGSPALASLAYAAPAAALEGTGSGLLGAGAVQTARTAVRGADNVADTARGASAVYRDPATGTFTPEALAKLRELQAARPQQAQGAWTAEEVAPPEVLERFAREAQAGQASPITPEQPSNIMTPEEAERYNLFTRNQIPVTRADVTQMGDDFIKQQELAKGSNNLSRLLAEQDEALANRAREGVENIGVLTSNASETNQHLGRVVTDIAQALDDDVNAAYAAAREAVPDEKIVKPIGLADALKANAGDNAISGNVITSVRAKLKNDGVLGPKFTVQGRIDAGQAESIRQHLNSIYESATPRGKMIIRELKDALDNDVERAVGKDIFADARASKVRFHKIMEKQKRNKFDKSGQSLLERIMNNKVDEREIISKLKTARDDDFMKIKDFYLNDAGPEGIQAWNNFKGQVLRDALDAATSTLGKGEGGTVKFNVNQFRKQFDALKGGKSGGSKKYNELFNEAERQLIDDITEIGMLRIPKTGTFSGEGPSAQAVNAARNAVLQRIGELVPFGKGAAGMVDLISGKTMREVKQAIDPAADTEKALRRAN